MHWTEKFFIKESKYWLCLMNEYWKDAPSVLWNDTDKYVILHKPHYDRFHSILTDNYEIYRKEGKDLKLETISPPQLKIYSQNELTEMVEKKDYNL